MQQQINELKAIVSEQVILTREIHTAIKGNDLGTSGIVNDISENKDLIKENKEEIDTNTKSITNIKSTSMLYGGGAAGGIGVIWMGFKAWLAGKFGG